MNEEIISKAVQLLDKISTKVDISGISGQSLQNEILEKVKQHQSCIPAQLPQIETVKPINIAAVKQDKPVEKQIVNDISDKNTEKFTVITKTEIEQFLDIDKTISSKLPQFHHNYQKTFERQKLSGIAIIQAFYGTDVSRILATTRALQFTLNSNPIAEDFVFVEAQTNKNKAVFGWLKDYNVKYVFKKIDKDSEGLFLKTALWNIGVTETKAERFCFIDSDVVFCNQNWLEAVNCAFDNYDVLSLAGYCYYENNKKYNNICTSIGHNVMTSNETSFDGHIGFNIGMTKNAYEKYGRFEAFNMHDDMWIWHKIFGTNLKPDIIGFTPYKTTDDIKFGLPFKVGSTEEIACHLFHENRINKYKLYGYISYFGTERPFEDIEYDRSDVNVLPSWSDSKVGQCIRYAFKLINDIEEVKQDFKQQAEDIILEARKKIYGEIDEQHPLIIMTAFVSDFKHKSIESVFEHKDLLERYCQQPFTYVCFTDEISTEEASERGLDVIPFSNEKVRNDRSLWKSEMERKDIKLQKNASVVWIDINDKIDKDLNFTQHIIN